MARAYWKGLLRLSLVTCPVALHATAVDGARLAFNQFNRLTGNRIRQPKIDEVTGTHVEADDIVRGYRAGDEPPVEISDLELAAIAPDASREIAIDSFVPRDDVDLAYVSRSYHVVPDGESGLDAYAVIRDLLAKGRKAAMARIVIGRREHMLALVARGDGLMALTLRYPYEMSDEPDFPAPARITRDMRSLAKNLMERKSGKFEPAKFRDRYEEALLDLVARKRRGEKIAPAPPKRPRVVDDLMEALRQSVRPSRSRRLRGAPSRTAVKVKAGKPSGGGRRRTR